ncbi:hypothetical protein NM208_g11983 [Fusarium decemcellulare]|uniref:Uncharacterized protein n=1 Tax=Fusarium decemcellulare TaxID=57161 RepID=A0ACC1RRP1_9HYPO|nr:hypothetical protein NM208_g11983 [Fusarium decemcellulare]
MSRSDRISPAQWDAHKDHIHSLYIDQDKTLDEVMHHMGQEYNFHASKSQYIRRITVVWKMKKNFTKTQWEQAHSLISKRKAEGKSTELVMSGTIVPRKRLKKELKRYPVSQTEQSDAFRDLSCDVVARTPPELELEPVTYNAIHELRPLDPIGASASPDSIQPCSIEPGLVAFNPSTWGNSSWQHYLTAGKNFNPSYLVNQLLQNTLSTSQMSWSTCIALTKMAEMITGTCLHNVDGDLEALPAMTSEQWNTFLPGAISLSARGLLSGTALDQLLQLVIRTGAMAALGQAIVINDPMIRIFASNLLISAIRVCKRTDLVHSLLQRGVSPDSTEASSSGRWRGPRRSALQTAVIYGNQPAVRLLLDYRADPNLTCGENEGYPLSLALETRELSHIAEILIDKGADVTRAGCADWPRPNKAPIIQAVENQDTARVKQLIQARADPNTLTSIGVSALHMAIRHHDLATVRILLEAEADPNILCGNRQCSAVKSARDLLIATSGDFSYSLASPIAAAAHRGNEDIVELLLAAGADIDGHIDQDLFSDLDFDFLTPNMLEDHPSRTALQTAIMWSDIAMVKFLLMKGANPNAGHHTIPSPLRLACELKERSPQKLDLVKLLLEWGADMNAPATHQGGQTVLQAVINTGRSDLTRILLYYRGTVSADLLNEYDSSWLRVADPYRTERMFESLCQKEKLKMDLQAAVKSGSTTGVQQLLEAVGDINGQNVGHSLLCESIWRKDSEMFDFLLSKGTHPDPKDVDPTPLWVATHEENRHMIQCLLNAGAEPNRPSAHIGPSNPYRRYYPKECSDCDLVPIGPRRKPKIETPIMRAVLIKRADLVQMLVAAGASVNPSISDSLEPPLVLAARDSAWQIEHLLLHHGADPNSTGRNSKMAALHHTLLDGCNYDMEKVRMCKILIDYGADANAPSGEGSPIQLAVAWGDLPTEMEMIEVLVDAGADVNAPATEGFPMTTLQKAIKGRHCQEIVPWLLRKGADIHAPAFWKGGMTALQAAAEAGIVGLVNEFISSGADVSALPARERGATALQFAAMKGDIKVVKTLLENGANINAPGAEIGGRTALQGAAEHGQLDMVSFLLDNDNQDDADLVKGRCHNAAEYAEAEGHFMLAGMLREWKKPENDGVGRLA